MKTKKLVIAVALLFAAACGNNKSKNNTAQGNMAYEGGVQFTKSAVFCQGGEFSVAAGATMSWTEVQARFGGFGILNQEIAEEVEPEGRGGSIVLNPTGYFFTGVELGKNAGYKAGMSRPILTNDSDYYDSGSDGGTESIYDW